MNLDLKDKVILVTASTKGIGLGVARVFALEGARLAISSRTSTNLKKATKLISKESGAEVLGIRANLNVAGDVREMVRQAFTHYGGLDVLVHNAGPPRTGSIFDLSDSDWEHSVQLLLLSAVQITKRVLPAMLRKRWGRLIYLTSVSLKEPIPDLILSNTVRLGIAGLVKSLATEFGPCGITANGIMPGYINTARIENLARAKAAKTGRQLSQILTNYASEVPARRLGTPMEIGKLAAFLASENASYINGTMMPVDGGLLRSIL